jgi:hypothetical protein
VVAGQKWSNTMNPLCYFRTDNINVQGPFIPGAHTSVPWGSWS